jgi:hypothetical protein
LTLDDHLALARAPKLNSSVRGKAADVAGKIWNSPNTVLGLGYGVAGYGLGQLKRLLPGDQPDPRIQAGHNAVEFINNPLGGVGAITIGNTTTYADDPFSPEGRKAWRQTEMNEGHPVWEHEQKHTIQSQQLGPLYLPSNLLGGLNAKLHGEDWHGAHNWNEQGPKMNPPRAWPPRR